MSAMRGEHLHRWRSARADVEGALCNLRRAARRYIWRRRITLLIERLRLARGRREQRQP